MLIKKTRLETAEDGCRKEYPYVTLLKKNHYQMIEYNIALEVD